MVFARRNRRKPQRASARIANVLAKIRTEHLLNTNLACYHYVSLPSEMFLIWCTFNKIMWKNYLFLFTVLISVLLILDSYRQK
jgi:hypothetical protein